MRRLEFKVISGDARHTKFMQAADVFSNAKVLGNYEEMILTIEGDAEEEVVLNALLTALQQSGQIVSFIYLNDDVLWCNPKVQCVSSGHQWLTLYDFVTNKFPSLNIKTNEHMFITSVNGKQF